ncbi:hypothetical protein BHE74_00053084 [Ensete ventricosum]|nr:hypothetical protein GW17_00021518 [Ensete ventricosum]RWW41436.1 hypothetical protein BHE74_00053084 [Ensete ventricosum]RZR95415.1 hypothetical protein BHM03_00024261 [Ensete ventricosum]
MSLPWARSLSNPTVVGALRNALRGICSSCEWRRPVASSPALPSLTFRFSKHLSVSRNHLKMPDGLFLKEGCIAWYALTYHSVSRIVPYRAKLITPLWYKIKNLAWKSLY